ncbi:MAG: nucleotide exchange factor GrpE [Muribaculaceae bacterium]|nr:nucleotide exchange factor GrpE [Muribaculaceae bacterium]
MVEGEDEPQILDNFDAVEDGDETADSDDDAAEASAPEDNSPEKEIESLQAQLDKEKKDYLFLMAEFDNFRKRTLKEKSEIIKNASEKVFKGLLPIVDDMERGLKASENATDVNTVREGLALIYNKLIKFMEANGVKAYDEADDTFDADRHEAITAVPVADEAQKGKILDTIEKGYTINDKVLRHARVVVGQ